jgi:molecular chaperone DnaK
VSPEEAVALGAAVQGGILSGCVGGIALVDVTPLGLGVEHTGGTMHTMVPRNSIIPLRAKTLFTTVQDFQKCVNIHVLQGERPLAGDNISLGSFRMDGIRPAPKGEPKIEVTFEIDADGIVHVSAEDLDTRSSCEMRLDNTMAVAGEEASARITEARAFELDDLRSAGRGARAAP